MEWEKYQPPEFSSYSKRFERKSYRADETRKMNTALILVRQPVKLAPDFFFLFLPVKFSVWSTAQDLVMLCLLKAWSKILWSQGKLSIEFIGLGLGFKTSGLKPLFQDPDSHPKVPEFSRCLFEEYLGEVSLFLIIFGDSQGKLLLITWFIHALYRLGGAACIILQCLLLIMETTW